MSASFAKLDINELKLLSDLSYFVASTPISDLLKLGNWDLSHIVGFCILYKIK